MAEVWVMMRLMVSTAAFVMFASVAFGGVTQTKGSVCVETPSLVATYLA